MSRLETMIQADPVKICRAWQIQDRPSQLPATVCRNLCLNVLYQADMLL
ncbi:MAG: hypothetical protein J6J86_08390 [Lachnospiraceae bacterium]|nr:hypothetical protein [Lachnospiraceae bacterium]